MGGRTDGGEGKGRGGAKRNDDDVGEERRLSVERQGENDDVRFDVTGGGMWGGESDRW